MIHKYNKGSDESRTFIVGFGDKLAADELLTGTPTVAQVSVWEGTVDSAESSLSFSDAALTAADQEVNGRVIKTSEGVQFTVSGGSAGTVYRIRVTAMTDASPVQTLSVNFDLLVYA